MEKKPVDVRREEIINACEELYKKENFKDITLKQIGEKTTFSRTSIYNYFQTKEEIFLALFQREYEKWIEDLNKIYEKNERLMIEELADKLAHTIEKRPTLLKLLAMNLYDMEDNSKMEALVEFKQAYGNSIKAVKRCLDKFVTNMNEEEKTNFILSFFPFMYGIYPYAVVTAKQKEAMEKADVPFKKLTIYEIAYMGTLKLLK
ncbi:MAG: TetR family transcriptional regulator [Clostridia bacterium]|jgi:AcrR family transcriptional regulator